MSTSNQTWWLKELFNGLSLVAALVMLVPLTKLLLTIPWFAAARTDISPAPPKPKGKRRGNILDYLRHLSSRCLRNLHPLIGS